MPDLPSEEEVLSWFASLSNWGRWGQDDRLGTLNLVTPAKRAEAAALVTEGIAVSCAWDIETSARADTGPRVPQRYMVGTGEGLSDPERVRSPGVSPDERAAGAAEFIGLIYHGYSVTHIDGLSHIFWDGRMYNGLPAAAVTAAMGATRHDIRALSGGIVTRGVLLDVAGKTDREWLEPGEAVFPEDLEAAEVREGVRVGEGDVLLLRTGYGRKRHEQGPDDVATVGRPGWHAACLPWFKERGVAAIGADVAQEAVPSGYPALRMPVHVIGIVGMGLWLVDNCDLEALHDTCTGLGRYEFQFVLAPLRWLGATGSPANPLAVF